VPDPSSADITAVVATENGRTHLANVWPYLVRSISYMSDQMTLGLGLGGEVQHVPLVSDAATTATANVILISGQSGNTDTFSSIPIAPYQAGSIVMVGLYDEGTNPNYKNIKVLSSVGGSGQLLLKDAYFNLNREEQLIAFQLRGTDWVEIFRSGREYIRRVLGASTPTLPALVGETEVSLASPFNNSGSEISYYKDSDGNVHMYVGLASSSNLSSTFFDITSNNLPDQYLPALNQTMSINVQTAAGAMYPGLLVLFAGGSIRLVLQVGGIAALCNGGVVFSYAAA
jgi:hypothetical protein